MRTCQKVEEKLIVSFSYDATLVDKIKKFPSYCRRWNPKEKHWVFNFDVSNKEEIKNNVYDFLNKNQFSLTSDILEFLDVKSNKKTSKSEVYEASFDTDADIEVDILQHDLRPFQRAGVKYLVDQKKSFLADEMGLGKTVQALAATAYNNAFPCLILCPVSLQKNWTKEIIKWFDVWATFAEHPSRHSDFNIVPYSQIKKYKDLISSISYKTLICDESHYLKNSSAARTKLVKNISKNCPNVYMLSGTPILNRPSELISQLEILNRLSELGGWKYYTMNYCAAYKDRFGLNISGSKNLDILNQELRKRCYIRREKKNVLKELPDKQRIIIDMELASIDNYKNCEIEVLEEIKIRKENHLDNARILPEVFKLNSLSQNKEILIEEINKPSSDDLLKIEKIRSNKALTNYAINFFERKADNIINAEALMLLNKLKQRCAEEKMDSVLSWIHEFMLNGSKLIVFADNIKIQQRLVVELQKYNPASVLGEMNAQTRQLNVEKFQKSSSCKIIVCSLNAAGVGITLTAASDVAFVQCGWTPALHDQAEDRAHRIGQENAVTCYYLLCPNTIDEDIWSLINAKREVVNEASIGSSNSTSDISSIVSNIQKRLNLN